MTPSKRTLILLSSLLVVVTSATADTSGDQPWEKVAQEMTAAAKAGKKAGPILEKKLPKLAEQMKSDGKRQAMKKLWGSSINYDELAHGVIVDPAILRAIGDLMKIQSPQQMTHIKGGMHKDWIGAPKAIDAAGHQIVHAGMEHTYGYLFSVLKTQFGFKRARWVQGDIEKGFALTEGLLGPTPKNGTLFSNVTFFIGNIAFQSDSLRLELLKKDGRDLSADLTEFDFSKLKPIRVEETVDAKDTIGDIRKVVLRTDLVPFTVQPASADKNSHLLIYSVVDPSIGGARLITAFPVAKGFVDMVTRAEDLGENKSVKTRYNAYVEGVSDSTVTGTRKVIR